MERPGVLVLASLVTLLAVSLVPAQAGVGLTIAPHRVEAAVAADTPLSLPFVTYGGATRNVLVALSWNDLLRPDAPVKENLQDVPRDPTVTLLGTVVGDAAAAARFTLSPDGLFGYVLTDDGWTFYVPTRWSDPAAVAGALAVVPWTPGAGLPMHAHDDALPSPAREDSRALAAEPVPRVDRVFLEGDNEFALGTGTSLTWQQRQLTLLNLAEGIYEREVQVSFSVVGQHTWIAKVPGYPYDRTPGPSAYLIQFRNYWEATEPGLFRPRDEAVMFTGVAWNEAYGYAFIGALNDPWAYAFAWSTFLLGFNSYSPHQTVLLLSHEIGHNFDGLHELASFAYPPGGNPTPLGHPQFSSARTIMDPSIRLDVPQFSDGSWRSELDNKGRMLAIAADRLATV